MNSLAPVQRLAPRDRISRHAHAGAYATLVLDGEYVEFGETGRIEARPGDVVLHAGYCAHADQAGPAGADLINIALPAMAFTGRARPADPDMLVRLARHDPAAAAEMILTLDAEPYTAERDWADRLAVQLSREEVDLAGFARAMGLRKESLSRGFRLSFGVAPRSFAAEARARRALRCILTGADPLADVAAQTGFCDQAHMTRAVVALTGVSPGRWRGAAAFSRRASA